MNEMVHDYKANGTSTRGGREKTKAQKSLSKVVKATPKRPYNRVLPRTTPVGRAGRNLKRAHKVLGFSLERISAWLKSGRGALSAQVEKKLGDLAGGFEEVMSRLLALETLAKELEDLKFAPIDANKVPLKEGEPIKIVSRYRKKYLAAYSAAVIDSLQVKKAEIPFNLGEILVGSGKVHFFVPHRQLERR